MSTALIMIITVAFNLLISADQLIVGEPDDLEMDHPLNDAWLGMPVNTQNGSDVGYVSDVLMQSDGQITHILVTAYTSDLNKTALTYKIPAAHTELLDTHVEIKG